MVKWHWGRFALTGMIGVFILLQYRLWFEPGGVIDLLHLKKEAKTIAQQNEQLKKRNDVLIAEVHHLQQDKAGIESRARHELGMIKKGETFYEVK